MQRDGFRRVVFGLEPQRLPQAAGGASHFAGPFGVYATNEAIKKNRSLIDGRWDKNDTKDSANVADLVAQGKCTITICRISGCGICAACCCCASA